MKLQNMEHQISHQYLGKQVDIYPTNYGAIQRDHPFISTSSNSFDTGTTFNNNFPKDKTL